MSGELDLGRLQRHMDPEIQPGTFVYCSFPDFKIPHGLTPTFTFAEAEGLTAIVERSQAQRLNLPFAFVSRQITLTVHSALEAVGFLASLTGQLAAANIPCNVISAFHHDHLFVPEAEAEAAMALLESLRSHWSGVTP